MFFIFLLPVFIKASLQHPRFNLSYSYVQTTPRIVTETDLTINEYILLFNDNIDDNLRHKVKTLKDYLIKTDLPSALDYEKIESSKLFVFQSLKRNYSLSVLIVRTRGDIYDRLRNRRDVFKRIERNKILRLRKVESCLQQQTPFYNLPKLSYEDIGFVYPESQGEGVKVYIIDTGIYVDHPDFEGRASFGVDLTGEGYEDFEGHGTHVAGIVSSKTYGVAKKAETRAVKILKADGSGTTSALIEAFHWVIQEVLREKTETGKKPKVIINMSLGMSISDVVNDIVGAVVSHGIPVVVAAGNEDTNACLTSPASVPEAITVGAMDTYDRRASFSNFGSCVNIFAPGTTILSLSKDGGTAVLSGTSQAAPHITGILALQLSELTSSLANEHQLPELLLQTLLKNAKEGLIDNVKGSPNRLGQAPPCGLQVYTRNKNI